MKKKAIQNLINAFKQGLDPHNKADHCIERRPKKAPKKPRK